MGNVSVSCFGFFVILLIPEFLQPEEIKENLSNLLDSISKNDVRKTEKFRTILKEEALREQQAFDTVKNDLRFKRHRNANKRKNTDSEMGDRAEAFKREASTASNTLVKSTIPDHHQETTTGLPLSKTGAYSLKEQELQSVRPYFAVQKWIETYEAILAPEYDDPGAAFKTPDDQMNFHAVKWTKILEKKDDPTVQQLMNLLNATKIPHDAFCHRIGGFFFISCGKMYVPPLKSYTAAEMEAFFRDNIEINDDLTIKSVTEVIMKM